MNKFQKIFIFALSILQAHTYTTMSEHLNRNLEEFSFLEKLTNEEIVDHL